MKYEKLKNLTSKIGSGVTPKGGKKAYSNSGVTRLIRSQNIYNNDFEEKGLVFITEEQAAKMSSVSVQKNDILINITGDSVARATIVPNGVLPARVNQHVSIIRAKNGVSPYYILGVLTSLKTQKILLSIAQTGGTRAALTKGMLENLDIPVLDRKTTQYIACINRLLSDKIDLNNQMIATLEELAATLFKRWFVDFEFPDENGNPYKSSGGKMVDSELGEIPEGWEVAALSNAFKHKKEAFNPRKYQNRDVLHFSMPSFDKNQMPISDNSDDIKSNKNIIGKYTVLFSKMNPEIKRVWLPNYQDGILNVTSTEFIVVDTNNKEEQSFLYSLLSSMSFQNYLLNNVTGSTGSRQRIKPDIAMQYSFAYNENYSKLLAEILCPLTSQIMDFRLENQSLNNLRDSLLPKLLSGELEI